MGNRSRVGLAGIAAAVILAACSSGTPAAGTAAATQAASQPATSPAPATAPPATSAPASTPGTGPASATLTFVGDPHLAAGQALPVVQCNFPNPAGSLINLVIGAADQADAAFVTIQDGKVNVRVSAGSGATFTSRTFTGTGVSGFDAARGATLNSQLTETTAPGAATGAIPVLTSLAGAVNCGGQTAGSGTVHVTATLPEGAVDGDLNPIRVACNVDTAGKTTVVVTGLVDVGTTKFVFAATIQPTGMATVFFATAPATHFLNATATTSGTISGQGGTFNADAVTPPGVSPEIKAHVSGPVVCGSNG